jgi:translation initiation factor IF-2
MAEDKSMRLSQVAKILNVGIGSVIKDLSAKGFKVDMNPNAKISYNQLEILAKDHKNTELLSKASAPAPKPEPVAAPAPVVKPTPAPQPTVAQPAPKPVEPPKPVQPTPVSVPVAKTEAPAPKPVEPAPVQTSAPAPAPKPVEAAPVAKVEETPAPKPVESPKPTTPPVAVQQTPAPAPEPQQPRPAAEKPAEAASANDLLSRPVVQGLKVLGKIDLNPPKPAQPQNRDRDGGPREGNRPNREGGFGQRDNRPNRDGGQRDNRNEGGQRQGPAKTVRLKLGSNLPGRKSSRSHNHSNLRLFLFRSQNLN